MDRYQGFIGDLGLYAFFDAAFLQPCNSYRLKNFFDYSLIQF